MGTPLPPPLRLHLHLRRQPPPPPQSGSRAALARFLSCQAKGPAWISGLGPAGAGVGWGWGCALSVEGGLGTCRPSGNSQTGRQRFQLDAPRAWEGEVKIVDPTCPVRGEGPAGDTR